MTNNLWFRHNRCTMVLPVNPNLDESEDLSEEALEAVAGGYFIKSRDGAWIAGRDLPVLILEAE